MSCHVNFEGNNTGFSNIVYRAVDPNNLVNHTPPVVPGNCAETTVYPLIEIIQPLLDTTFEANLTQYTLKAKLTQGDILTAKVDFLQGTTIVAENLSVDLVDSTATYIWNVPSNVGNITAFTARVRDAGFVSFSEVKKFTRITPVSTNHLAKGDKWDLVVFPNPTNAKEPVHVRLPNAELSLTFTLFDLTGKKLNSNFERESHGDYVLTNQKELKPGIYLLKAEGENAMKMVRLVVQ
jgi:hypothetical protein